MVQCVKYPDPLLKGQGESKSFFVLVDLDLTVLAFVQSEKLSLCEYFEIPLNRVNAYQDVLFLKKTFNILSELCYEYFLTLQLFKCKGCKLKKCEPLYSISKQLLKSVYHCYF